MKEVEKYYDEVFEEWRRLEIHRFEFEITKRYMQKYIPNHAKVLDIGGGPGQYALYLSQEGHDVSLLDLSFHNIEVAKRKQNELGVSLTLCEKANALQLEKYEDEAYDVVLLMGPLYHLVNLEDRELCMQQALRKVKPGGIIFTAFISTYAPLQDCLYANSFMNESVDEILHYLDNGLNKTGFTTAYFSGHQEIRDFMASFALKEIAFAGVENVLSTKEKDLLKQSEEDIRKWIEIGYRLSQDESLFGSSQHYLYIGQKLLRDGNS